MFEMRLGLALGKSLGEIKALPHAEILEWEAFYQLEPFGWHDREVRTARHLALLHNVNVKEKHQKSTAVFIRNMPALLLEYYRKSKPEFDLSTKEGRRKATERAVKTLKRFGAIDKRKG